MLRRTRNAIKRTSNYANLLALSEIDEDLNKNINRQIEKRGKIFGLEKTLKLPENNQIDGGNMRYVSAGRVFE